MVNDSQARELFSDALAGRVGRRDLLKRAAAIGLSGPVVAALVQASSRPAMAAQDEEALNLTYYDWILNLHPAIDAVNSDFSADQGDLNAEVAPVAGFGIERFVAEAADKMSTWDAYIGMTPFVEMVSLVEAGVIEPWDPYIPQDVLDDLIPSIREEGTYNGKLYNWPFLLDIIVQGWNADIVARADLNPEVGPANWEEFIANAAQVVESGAAPFGCTFDAHGWRSLAPITHSINPGAYTPAGLFDFTSDAAVEALEIMKRMMEYANPDVLNEGTSDAGVNQTPDEGAFAAQQVAYYVKYQNAHLRFAGAWPDPAQLRLANLPTAEGGAGATVFWDTGAALFTFGKNKERAAAYMRALTYDDRIWQQSITGSDDDPAVGQLPVYQSIWESYRSSPPEWLPDWAFLIFDQLQQSQAIKTHQFGVTQFVIGKPHWERYLTGETDDPRAAMQAAQDAVLAEVAKTAAGTPTA